MLKYGLKDEGYHFDLQYSDNAADVQASQIESHIKMGCDVLVIATVDHDALGNVLEKAKELLIDSGLYMESEIPTE